MHYDFLNAYSDFPLVNSITGGLRLWLENTKNNNKIKKKENLCVCVCIYLKNLI